MINLGLSYPQVLALVTKYGGLGMWNPYLEMLCKLLIDGQVIFYTKKEFIGIW